ncbi:16S rRNA (adenine(1518)-N(6)/adenine(1519)-N(6))-dimethyltransferase RsmA [bacterium]|nr:16S rRNA (adenine(1518)-N(6)/adenine(1519)-N(6))-dimethyltransferase RsmA [bacterium]
MEFLTVKKIIKLIQSGQVNVKKHLGQNFLIDRNSRDKIISFAEIEDTDTVVEIGPGLGALTEKLIEQSKDVYAFEVDPQFCGILKERFSGVKSFHLLEGDFLQADEKWWQTLPPKVKLISNTPYYLSSQISFKIIQFRDHISTALITVQKEVGEKITSKWGSKNYGELSVLNYIYTNSKICYSLKRDVFFPKPEVNSVVVKIQPLEKPKFQIEEEKSFQNFLHHIFMLRRKKLINVINKVFSLKKEVFKNISTEELLFFDKRAEDLTPENIYKVFTIINALKKDNKGET